MRKSQGSFKPYLNPLGAWALAFGCSIGWGAFLIPSTLLPKSGILGSIIGVVIGVLIMLVIAWNYRTMIALHPKAGGAFTYVSRVLDFDHGFLCAWFLCLTYLGLIWANVSAFALLGRYMLGDAFQAHFLYTFAGFDIYLEEVALCLGATLLAGAICIFRKKLAQGAQILFALVLAVGLFVIFALVLKAHPADAAIAPLFMPNESPALQTLGAIAVIPWAFVGFESISHSAEEFSFAPAKSFRIMALAIAMAALAYIFMLLISVMSLPDGYASWVDYVGDADSLGGISAIPTFSAIHLALGDEGLALLCVTMLGALFSSLVGNMICLSRLICSMAESEIFPAWFGKINDEGIPRNTILAIVVVSLFVPFLGRTAIGWNVDVLNIGATVAYGYTSLTAFRHSQATHDKATRVFGVVGTVVSVVFLLLMLLPGNSLAQESCLVFSGWVVVGFLLKYSTFKRDREHRYGRSTIVWKVLFLLSIYASFSYVWQASIDNTAMTAQAIDAFFTADSQGPPQDAAAFINAALEENRLAEVRDYLIAFATILISLRILLGNYAIMNKREADYAKELGETREKAFTDKLTGVKSVNAYRDNELRIDANIKAGQMTEFAIAICDVNNVKEVNDRFGHQAGDEYIRTGCGIICKIFEHSPVYRIGGDEFVLVLSGGDYERREQLRRQLEEVNAAHLQTGEIVIAAGISDWRQTKEDSVADVFARADIKMYQRKSELKGLSPSR